MAKTKDTLSLIGLVVFVPIMVLAAPIAITVVGTLIGITAFIGIGIFIVRVCTDSEDEEKDKPP